MKEKKNSENPEVLVYLVLFLLCLLPEVIYFGRLGFYWDDWSQLFLHTKFGDAAFPDYYAYNRPLSAWTDMLYFPICGSSPQRWHFLMIVLRFLLCGLFYKILISVLTGKEKLSFTAAILFAVCPLFSQSYISIAYTQHFTDFILYGSSVLFLLKSVSVDAKSKKIALYFLSIVCTILHLTITEYFVFLELIKIPVLFAAVKNKGKNLNCLHKIITYYALHFLIFILYCLYRLKITDFFPNAGQESPELIYLFHQSPVQAIHSFLKNTAVDLLYPFTRFISGLFDVNIQSILTGSELIKIFVPLFAAVFIFSFIYHLVKGNFVNNVLETFTIPAFLSGHRNGITILLICLGGIFFGVLPFLIMNENVLNTNDPAHADRTFLAAMPFVCMIFALFLSGFFPNRKHYAAAVSLVIFLFCHGQMDSYLSAVQFSEEQNSFYQQMLTRMPGIIDGTALVDDTIIFPEQGNFATASALNVLYPNTIRDNGDVPLWIFSYPERTREEHGIFNVQNRIYHFKQPATDYIYIDYDNQYANCVWIYTPQDVDNPHITDLQRGWIAGTGIDRVQLDEAFTPDERIFGKENDNWCRYYQQAGMLLQKEDWIDLSELTSDVLNAGFSPSDSRSNSPFEWWPFIAGLLHEGKTEQARALADEAVRVDGAYKDFFDKRFAEFMK